MMKYIMKHYGLEVTILLTISILTGAERALLLVPTIQYAFIMLVIFGCLIALIANLLFPDKNRSFLNHYHKLYKITLFIILSIISITLWAVAVYATFFMYQAKNMYLISIIWILALLTTPNKIYFNLAFKYPQQSENTSKNVLINIVVFLMIVMLMFLSMIITYNFPYMMIYRLFIGLVLTGFYVTVIRLLSQVQIDGRV